MRSKVVFILFAFAGCGPRPETPAADDLSPSKVEGTVFERIERPGLPSLHLTAEDGKVGVGIFQAGTGRPYLTLGDTDNDGVFDMLTYSSLNAGGKVLAVVEDFGMDGQPDLIINFEESTGSIYYDGKWRPILGIGTGKSSYIEIDGTTRGLDEVVSELGRRAF